MDFFKAARCCFIGAISLLAASCAATTPSPSGSDDNGANCGGTEINKESCINNQNRMQDSTVQ